MGSQESPAALRELQVQLGASRELPGAEQGAQGGPLKPKGRLQVQEDLLRGISGQEGDLRVAQAMEAEDLVKLHSLRAAWRAQK